MTDSKEQLQTMDKREVASPVEQTRPGRSYTPAVDIFEDSDALTILADMPGVNAQSLQVDLREGVLTLRGEVTPKEGEKEALVLREYDTGAFFRQFQLSDAIDPSGIDARMANGVLRLRLPKREESKPRQIQVHAG